MTGEIAHAPKADTNGDTADDEHGGMPLNIYPRPDAPMAVARQLFNACRDEDGIRTLLAWRGGWMLWRTTHWSEIDNAEVRSSIYQALEDAVYIKGLAFEPWRPTRNKVSNVMEAMAAIGCLPADIDPPSWIDKHDMDVAAEQVIACRNGLLNLTTRVLDHHSPALFNMVSVPFEFERNAKQPAAWLKFLNTVWADDTDSIMLLQEYFGYVLSGRTDLQKILMLIGPTRSGKGTIARLLTELVGRGHVCGPTLASLGTNFGLSPLLGRPLAIISDARLGNTGANTVVERLLSISGEDMLTIDRKYREPWSGKLPTRLVVLSNELPKFRDSSAAIANRLLILQMTQSFLGREDRTLDRKLRGELPGILNWALEGLGRLTENGSFTVPAASDHATALIAGGRR
jgi:putative DNA primase/helicase